MSAGLDLSETKALLSTAARAVIANKDRLTKADQDIGDGDHGVGMARGFAAVEQATAKEVRTMQELFRGCGQALMMASGGASGVVFGTMFQGAANRLKGDVFDAEALVLALEGGLKAVQDRGKAKIGDKTMVDALAPAAEAARKALAGSGVDRRSRCGCGQGCRRRGGSNARIGCEDRKGERIGRPNRRVHRSRRADHEHPAGFDCQYATKPGPVVVALWRYARSATAPVRRCAMRGARSQGRRLGLCGGKVGKQRFPVAAVVGDAGGGS